RLELLEADARLTSVGKQGYRLLDLADRHQLGRVDAPADRRSQDPVHAHAVLPERLAEPAPLPAPDVVEVPLRCTAVHPEARRVSAIAGRRIGMSNECDMASRDESGPGLLGIRGHRLGRSEEQARKNQARYSTRPRCHPDSPREELAGSYVRCSSA